MSLIGTLEQFSLALVLQRIEDHEKTGLFKIQQGTQWVDLYFRKGRLMCISQQHVNRPLGERLVESGIISAQVLQQAILATGDELPDETRLVITLMDLGYVEREELRAWAKKEAIQVLQELLKLTGGELYFEEDVQPPVGRLLVSLSISTLLSAITTPGSLRATLLVPDQQPAPAAPASTSQRAQTILEQETVLTEIISAPTLFGSAQSQQEAETQYPSLAPDLSDSFLSAINFSNDPGSLLSQSLQPAPATPTQPAQSSQSDNDPLTPIRVTTPVLSGRVDTSFLLPDSILMPVDLSSLRDGNQRVQFTPAQWRLLTQVDGRTTLQTACMQLGLGPDVICQLAGELLAIGLVSMLIPGAMNDGASPAPQQLINGPLVTSYNAPAPVAVSVNPQVTTMSATAEHETQSQWGNGANGTKFVPGRGWVTGPQPFLSSQSNNPGSSHYAPNNAYATGVR